jgi:nitroreductase
MTRLIEQVLDEARWAPSGDNTQPWHFRILSDDAVDILGHDTREDCVYDLDGSASRIAHGCLIETLRIAASAHGLGIGWSCSPEGDSAHPVYSVRLTPQPGLTPDPRIPCIRTRSVQRRAMSTRQLSAEHVKALNAAAAPYRIVWMTGFGQRLSIGRLNFRSAKIRLTIPEAFEVHRRVIEWGARFSEDRIPEQAVGVDPLTGKTMGWMLQKWSRVEFFNRYVGGTLTPRLQLDLAPGLACGAHALLVAPGAPDTPRDFVDAGIAIQRFWLEAERCGLKLQPELTPLIFSRYARQGIAFTGVRPAIERAQEICGTLEQLFGKKDAESAVFLCRLGYEPTAVSRSLRLPLEKLLRS